MEDVVALLLWSVKVLILAVLVGVPFLVTVVLLSRALYSKIFKKLEERGFTLIEVLVVLIIIGLIAAIIVPRITGRVDEARIEQTKIQMKAIKNALEQFKLDNGFYPTTEQGLRALVEKPTTPPEPKRWRRYLDRVPKDAWGRDFIYVSPGVENPFELRSLGPDGEEGTEDDIDVWKI